MSPQELLAPRFKVIADYPHSIFELNEIISANSIFRNERCVVRGGNTFGPSWFSQWPSIFQPLQWWEERELSELPEYVKATSKISGVSVCRVKWRIALNGIPYANNLAFDIDAWYPITDYPDMVPVNEAYQKQKA